MDLQTLTYIVVGFTFALYIGIAIWARAGSTKDFYVAGGGIHPVQNGMATAADWMSAASFISMAGLIALSYGGYGGSVFLMGWTGGYVILALLLAPYLRKYGKFTVPEFIGDRFYSNSARAVAVLCLIICSVTYVIGQMKGVGVAFSRFLEVDYDTGLYVGMTIVFFYAVLGGMKGITYTQIAQYCVLILAYTIPAIFISLQLTGNPLPQLGLGSTLVGTDVYLLDRLDQVVTDLGFKEYTTNVRLSGLNMFAYTMSLMIGTAGLPHVIIRFFTVPKVRDARSSAGWALVFIAILYTTAPAVAGMARLNLMQTIEPRAGSVPRLRRASAVVPQLGDHGPAAVRGQERRRPDPVLGRRRHNEMVKVDNDIMVLANPEIAQLPNWVIALVAAGGLAAALSTAAGLLLAISSAISHDLLKGMLTPNISEKTGAQCLARGDGRRDRRRRLPGPQSTGIRRRDRCPGLRPRRLVDLPGADDGYLQQAHVQGGCDRRHGGGYRRHPVLRVPAQGHHVHPRHRLPRRFTGELVPRYRAQRLRCGRRDRELCRGLRRVEGDRGSAGVRAGTGGEHPHPRRRGGGDRPLIGAAARIRGGTREGLPFLIVRLHSRRLQCVEETRMFKNRHVIIATAGNATAGDPGLVCRGQLWSVKSRSRRSPEPGLSAAGAKQLPLGQRAV
jgi:cation/acetate symporter